MGGRKSAGPPGMDPYEIMDAAAQYNRINQYTPQGSVVFSGPDKTEATVTLSPEQQAILEGQQGLTISALSQMMANMGLSGPSGAPGTILGGPTDTGYGLESGAVSGQAPDTVDLTAFGPLAATMLGMEGYLGGDIRGGPGVPGRERVEQAHFDRMMGLLRPEQERSRERLAQTLANRGVPEAAELAGRLTGRLEEDIGRQTERAALESILAGGTEMEREFGLGLQELESRRRGRGMLMNELMSLYGLGKGEEREQFNQLAALLGLSQVGTPGAGMAGFWQPGQADATGAFGTAQQGWNLGQQYSLGNQLMGLAGTLGGAFLGSGPF